VPGTPSVHGVAISGTSGLISMTVTKKTASTLVAEMGQRVPDTRAVMSTGPRRGQYDADHLNGVFHHKSHGPVVQGKISRYLSHEVDAIRADLDSTGIDTPGANSALGFCTTT